MAALTTFILLFLLCLAHASPLTPWTRDASRVCTTLTTPATVNNPRPTSGTFPPGAVLLVEHATTRTSGTESTGTEVTNTMPDLQQQQEQTESPTATTPAFQIEILTTTPLITSTTSSSSPVSPSSTTGMPGSPPTTTITQAPDPALEALALAAAEAEGGLGTYTDRFTQTTYWSCNTFAATTHCGWHEPILPVNGGGEDSSGAALRGSIGVGFLAMVVAGLVVA